MLENQLVAQQRRLSATSQAERRAPKVKLPPVPKRVPVPPYPLWKGKREND